MLKSPNQKMLNSRKAELEARLENFRALDFQLNMARGQPSPEQLDLARSILALPNQDQYHSKDGIDCRNYGGIDGLPEMKQLFGGILDCPQKNIIISNNSSLSMMHDAVMRAYIWGVSENERPWREQGTIRFLCPSPGYDRHFSISELFGFEMLPVEMGEMGPNMDQVEALTRDSSVKGIWCVPRYSNPTGVTYGDSTIKRLAKMEAASDFRVFWDNAYAEHHLVDHPMHLTNILEACASNNNPDRVLMFASTSKISFAGSGIAAMGGSLNNITKARSYISARTIGPDKINQLRHLHFFKDLDGLRSHMKAHARLLKPKFDLVDEILHCELDGKQIASWSKPKGGYFINLDVPDGCAREIIDLAAELGLILTPAGSSFPHSLDPKDRNIRISPTFPELDQIRQAIEMLAVCVELVAIRNQLNHRLDK